MNEASEFFNSICDLHSLESAAMGAFCKNIRGELFVEYKESEVFKIENGIVRSPNLESKRGFGLRRFSDDSAKYFYSSILDANEIKKRLNGNFEERAHLCEASRKNDLYPSSKFINSVSPAEKINFLRSLDEYARSKSANVKQVIATIAGSWQVVHIANDEGKISSDIRPLVRLSVVVVVERNGVLESGMMSGGGRFGYDELLNENTKINFVDEAVRQALVKLEAVPAPVGEMPVVLGNGWTGILLHEAVGHGLEGDAIRKKTSAFESLLGETIAAPGVTVVDDGTIQKRRGSLNIDDEGTETQSTVLIDNGKLVNFMQDRQNAYLMKAPLTGNGRREGYECLPMPRMTNTFMLGGDKTRDEMIASVQKGIFAKSFSDGQVDIASGKFVFSASEAYLIENGKITTPVKGAMLIGDGPSILKKISMVGNDFSLDNGVGTCGKDGQWVPVGVGEPSVLLSNVTVGGSALSS